MVLGRLAHYGFDLLAVTTVMAGIKKTTGFAPQTSLIPDETARSVADSYLGIGETVFASLSGIAVNSQYWTREVGAKR